MNAVATASSPPPLVAETLVRSLTTARKHDLGLGALQVLSLLGDGETHTLVILARQCGVKASALTLLAHRLHRLGFAIREDAHSDRRKVFLSITPKGRTALDSILAAE